MSDKFRIIVLLSILALAFACTSQKDQAEDIPETPPKEFTADTILFDSAADIMRTGKLFRRVGALDPADLPAGVPDLSIYGIVGAARGKYTVGGIDIQVRVDQYETFEGAYGAYAMNRPNGVAKSAFGTESYRQQATQYIYNGDQVFTLAAKNADVHSLDALSKLSFEIARRLPGEKPPGWFMLFPRKWKIDPSNQHYPETYMGVEGLDMIYTTDYDIEGDTATFFIAEDLGGEKFLALQTYAESLGETAAAPDSIEYEGYSVMFDHPEYGKVVGGIIRSKVVGIHHFNPDKHLALAHLWVKGLR